MITRRHFAAGLGAGMFVSVPSLAQQSGSVLRVGLLAPVRLEPTDSDYIYGPLVQGLRELGYVVGKNLVIEARSAEGVYERLPELAAQLVRSKIDVLATAGTPASRAAQRASSTIPIIMIGVSDPVANGLVKHLARPGGNSTALSLMTAELAPKLLEMLRSIIPTLTSVAALVNPANPYSDVWKKYARDAAQRVGINFLALEARSPQEIAEAFSTLAKLRVQALIVTLEQVFQQQRVQIVENAARHRLPSIGAYREYVEAGGLMSYGQNIRDNYRRAAIYIDKVFKGANAGDLPVEQPTKFELHINSRTARTLGLKIPQSLRIMADTVIE